MDPSAKHHAVVILLAVFAGAAVLFTGLIVSNRIEVEPYFPNGYMATRVIGAVIGLVTCAVVIGILQFW
ncbi:hypothetical protein FHS83_001882 [Rhizomicrobium palustre]|uniref:Uncharacterized protein n=1 Tax=Rhizomicrobium palustre TaxID=189966 RepID=A0A846MY63_9PROT|nr:hypothetical protein [Rhizomicrobium palustre]